MSDKNNNPNPTQSIVAESDTLFWSGEPDKNELKRALALHVTGAALFMLLAVFLIYKLGSNLVGCLIWAAFVIYYAIHVMRSMVQDCRLLSQKYELRASGFWTHDLAAKRSWCVPIRDVPHLQIRRTSRHVDILWKQAVHGPKRVIIVPAEGWFFLRNESELVGQLKVNAPQSRITDNDR